MTTPSEIKKVSLKYAVNLLKNREPKEKYKDLIKMKEELHAKRMSERICNDVDELPEDLFIKTLNQISMKPGNKYDFIKKAGPSYIQAILNLFKTVWKTEKIPEKWHESTLTQLFKPGKKDITDLKNSHHIHDCDPSGKIFSLIVIKQAKDKIFTNMSKYQIACRPGHRSSEHLFVIKSIMSYYKLKEKPLILTPFDLETFFDSEMLSDCCYELDKLREKCTYLSMK